MNKLNLSPCCNYEMELSDLITDLDTQNYWLECKCGKIWGQSQWTGILWFVGEKEELK